MSKRGPARKRADVRRRVREVQVGSESDFFDALILALLWSKVPVLQRKKILAEVMVDYVDNPMDQQVIQTMLDEIHVAYHEANPHHPHQ